jgi:hypothetical protein
VISYCIAAYRPSYVRMLVSDLVWKTSAPYEILVWVNVDDPGLDDFLEEAGRRYPVRVVGRTPGNIGMRAYGELFRAAGHELIAQVDDDVVCVSPGIAERARRLFSQHPRVCQLVADVWQDQHTTGARPPMSAYGCVDRQEGLYAGPIDGWFAVYHRSILPLLLSQPFGEYFPLGAAVKRSLAARGLSGLLCTRMKVFHTIGPEYASLFGMLDAEIDKYRRLGRREIVEWYSGARATLPPVEVLAERFAAAVGEIDGHDGRVR